MRKEYELIIVAGAPGAGKTSICEVLKGHSTISE